jgi:hypothetical protein
MSVRYIVFTGKSNGRRLNPLDNSEFHFPYVSGMAADSSQRISLYDRRTDKVL